jgi:hypothetical protein
VILLTVNTPRVGIATVNVAVESGIFTPLAWSTVEPFASAVTGTVAVFEPAANVAVAGTVATSRLLELTFTVKPEAGAAAERVSVTFCIPTAVNVKAGCGQLTVAATVTVWLAVV